MVFAVVVIVTSAIFGIDSIISTVARPTSTVIIATCRETIRITGTAVNITSLFVIIVTIKLEISGRARGTSSVVLALSVVSAVALSTNYGVVPLRRRRAVSQKVSIIAGSTGASRL